MKDSQYNRREFLAASTTVPAIAFFVGDALVRAEGESNSRAPAPTKQLYRSSYRVINVHTHAQFPSEASVRAELDVLDRVGVTAFNVLLVETSGSERWQNRGGWSEPNLLAWLDLRKRFPDRVLVFGTVDFRRVVKERTFFGDIVLELERHVRLGMQGVKIWKNLGMHLKDADGKLLRIDDPRLDLFWTRCGELGVPVLIHTADPKEYWYPKSYNTFNYGVQWDTAKYYQHPEVPKWEEL
ncbi:MAG: amidohydrolase family protein, partial [Planctomycetia bacterium]|nr:amidohydrolase family protein [Planctomycetia bacterium]